MKMRDEEKIPMEAMDGCAKGLVTMIVLVLLAVALLPGCRSISYVPMEVEKVHTVYQHTQDSVFHTDSVIREKETVVMQLDSSEMARYGVRLAQAERAWLVRTSELERELQRLSLLRADTVHKIDSVPVPYPVEVVKTKTDYTGWWAFGGLLLLIACVILMGYAIHKRQ